ncbi:MAG: hypothetical protein OEN00_13455, partial [Gemmatimonadota bacterium]|nr:hypothetical protein [Gemmatimonadota bacterium]
EDVQKVLTAGAVVGRRFDLRILEALDQVSGDALFDALEAAEEAHLLQPEPAGRHTVYKFSHELIRQTLVGRLSMPRRQRLHLRISGAMEEVYGSRIEEHAADYSYHLYQAGAAADPDTTIRFLTLAGEQALEAAAFEEALEHFELGLTVVEDPEPGQLAELLRKKGSAARGLGDWPAVLEAWNTALPLFEELGESDAVAQMCEEAALILSWEGRNDEAREIAHRGLRAAGEQPTLGRARLLAVLGWMEANCGDPKSGATIDEAIRLGEELGDTSVVAVAHACAQGAQHNQARFHAAVEFGERASEKLRSANDGWNLAQVLGFLQQDGVWRGRPTEAMSLGPEVRRLADKLGHNGAGVCADFAGLLADFMVHGDLDRLIARGRRGAEAWKPSGPWSHCGTLFESVGLFLKGEWDRSVEVAAAAVRDFPDENQWAGWFCGWELTAHAYAGTGAALGLYRNREDRIPRGSGAAVAGDRFFALNAIEALAVIGNREAAAALYPAGLDAVEGGLVALHSGLGQRYLGISAACGREWDVAEGHFRAALAEAHEIPYRTQQPEVRRWYAWMLLERGEPGDRERATELLNEAIPMFAEIGMPRHKEMAEGML